MCPRVAAMSVFGADVRTCARAWAWARQAMAAEHRHVLQQTAALQSSTSGHDYPLEVLRCSCPAGVDPAHKELALSPSDFLQLFGCTPAQFRAQPKWKRIKTKQSMGLF
eukprot:COSAG01_NODE_26755_length_704_cov_0.971901_1_plen_109_part_00